MNKDFEIKPEEYFGLSNGRILKNLNELLNALKSMDEETFKFHVNQEKNDFGNWIEDVFKYEDLANQIFNAKMREDIIKAVESKLFVEKEKREKYVKLEVIKKPETKKLIKAFPFVKSSPKAFLQKPEALGSIKSVPQRGLSLNKTEEILMKEKEIEKREEKIEEIEAKIEKELAELGAKKEPRFFSKEFMQGLLIGLLSALIIGLTYIKFFT
ncbi:MAG: hypothetical protein AABX32_07635 [Nanoarchaeota archaeon]